MSMFDSWDQMPLFEEWDVPEEYTPLVHEGNQPPRPHHIGEYVFLSRWQELMGVHEGENEDAPFSIILQDLCSNPTQRDATVAAEFIRWLGTNCGRGYLTQASELAAKLSNHHSDRPRAYVMQWTMTNTRVRHVNNGVRTIEWWFVNSEDKQSWSGPSWLPEISARDLEVAENIAHWLGTEAGQVFITQCEREITVLRRYEERIQTAAMNDQHLDANKMVSDTEWRVALHVQRFLGKEAA